MQAQENLQKAQIIYFGVGDSVDGSTIHFIINAITAKVLLLNESAPRKFPSISHANNDEKATSLHGKVTQ